MKRALVLAGGGSKGAYEVGFVKALRELNIDFQIITGTSIGALNGCLLAQQNFAAMEDLWNQLDITQVFTNGFSPQLSFDLDHMLTQSNLAISFFKTYLKEKGADITPLKTIIRHLLDEDQLLNSPIDFGLCTVYYPSLKPLLITKHEMEKEHIYDYLIASASCFPVFPVHSFLDQSFIDGGYYDNVPVDLAFEMGADEVIVVDMHLEPTHQHYCQRPHVIYTTPYLDLGTFMDFHKDSIERNKRIGYQTAMKTFHHYVGVKYTFYPFETPLFHLFYEQVLYLERRLRLIIRNDSADHFYSQFLEAHKNQPLEEKEYLYVCLDWLAELLDRDGSYVYQYDAFIDDVLKEFDQYRHQDFQIISFRSADELFHSFEHMNKKGVVGQLLHTMMYPQLEKFDIERFYNVFTKEIIMARLLYLLYQNHQG